MGNIDRFLSATILAATLSFSSVGVAAATKVQTAGLHYLIDQTPAWVSRVRVDSAPAAVAGAGAVQVLLLDDQINLLGPKPISYSRYRSVATERSGLESVSSVHMVFNPSYQTLTIHDLSVIRGGKKLDRLKTAKIDLVKREQRLESGIYDESVQAIIALSDIRVGDIVDCAYSIAGDNPVYGGKYADFFSLNQVQPVVQRNIRIVSPETRKLDFKLYHSDLTVAESKEGKSRVLSLSATNLLPIRLEPNVPPWYSLFPFLQVSEYGSWQDLAAWATGLYGVSKELDPEIDQVLDKIRADSKTPEDVVMKILSWVQNEIRYYSISVGTSSHRPNPPNITLKQRFGDCKDKSVLLSAMLQRAGFDAKPALVSFRIQKGVQDWLPSPNLFDHAITYLTLGEKKYWLDPTLSHQGNTLALLGYVPYGKAIVTGVPGQGLVDLEPHPDYRGGAKVTETFRIERFGDPATLKLDLRYDGILAEGLRRRVSEEGLTKLMEGELAEYGRDFPNISSVGEPSVSDDLQGNSLTISQKYSIPQLFTYESGVVRMAGVYARSIVPWYRFGGLPERRAPLSLPFPFDLEHVITVDLPKKAPQGPPAPYTWQDRHLSLYQRIGTDDNHVTISYRAKSFQDFVAAADYAAFAEGFKKGALTLSSGIGVSISENQPLQVRLTKDFERSDINFRKPDQLDNLKKKFIRDYAVADEAIKSGLLAGKLMAVAYKDRATAASLLNHKEEALKDVDRSLALDSVDEALTLKAQIQGYLGNHAAALGTLDQLLATGNNWDVQLDKGLNKFYIGQIEQAQALFEQAVKSAPPQDVTYPLIWQVVAAQRQGLSPSAFVNRYKVDSETGWPAQVIPYLLGTLSEEKLIEAASRDDAESRLRLCEAYFFMGQKAKSENRVNDARRWFGKSLDTRAIMYREFSYSEQEINRLAH